MESAAKRQKTETYNWKLTPIPKHDNKGKGKGGKIGGKPSVASSANAAGNNASTSVNAPAKGVSKGAPTAKSGKSIDASHSIQEKNPSAVAKFVPKSKAGAPVGKSVSQAVPKSTHLAASKAGGSAPTIAKAKASMIPTVATISEKPKISEKPSTQAGGKGKTATTQGGKGFVATAQGGGKGISSNFTGKGKGKGKGTPRACRCGNFSSEEYWQALESKETYCSNCWEKVQARSPTNPTFGLLLGLEAMRDLGVQLPIAV